MGEKRGQRWPISKTKQDVLAEVGLMNGSEIPAKKFGAPTLVLGLFLPSVAFDTDLDTLSDISIKGTVFEIAWIRPSFLFS